MAAATQKNKRKKNHFGWFRKWHSIMSWALWLNLSVDNELSTLTIARFSMLWIFCILKSTRSSLYMSLIINKSSSTKKLSTSKATAASDRTAVLARALEHDEPLLRRASDLFQEESKMLGDSPCDPWRGLSADCRYRNLLPEATLRHFHQKRCTYRSSLAGLSFS